MSASLTRLATFRLSPQRSLAIAQGSVLDYAHAHGAIVNAANEECLGGGGVDGAISNAGGMRLFQDRKALSVNDDGVRCPTGQARITGPNQYGSLKVNHVIHAVGPNYWDYDNPEQGDAFLSSAYRAALDCAQQSKLEGVAFSLLSAGVFRGSHSLKHVLQMGVESLCDWVAMRDHEMEEVTLGDIVMCGFNDKEVNTLIEIAREMEMEEVLDETSE